MSKIILQFDGPIARVTLNRPELLNALDDEACTLLLQAARKIEKTPGVRCVILSAAGKSFMAGADVNSMNAQLSNADLDLASEFESAVVRKANEFCQVMERLPVPVVVSARGYVAGGGLGLAACGDFLIVSDTAVFIAAHIQVGLSPDHGTSWYLNRLVGSRKAKEILMFGARISAADAKQFGLANEVVPDADLESFTDAYARKLVAMPAMAVANIKRLINSAPQHSFSDHLQMEAKMLAEASLTADYREGVRAFVEKRKPRFGQAG
ncbi:MAG: enoyl-CoA hydratase-related protein [Vicinamibacterales bacterium]